MGHIVYCGRIWKESRSLTPDPSPNGEGSGMYCLLWKDMEWDIPFIGEGFGMKWNVYRGAARNVPFTVERSSRHGCLLYTSDAADDANWV